VLGGQRDVPRQAVGLAAGLVVLWPIGVPCLFGALLIVSSHGQRHEALGRATRFLHAEYRDGCRLWEVAQALRKLVLTGFLLLLPQEMSTIRLFLALLFSVSFLVLVQTSRPFVDASSQFATVASQTILCFTRVLALLFKSVKSLPAGVDLQRALASRPPSGSRRRSSASTLRCSCSRCCLS